MNTHVDFKTAKLLKEKGYFYKTHKYYTTENPHSFHKDLDGTCILGLLHSKTLYQEYTERDDESGLLFYQLDPAVVHAPTIAEVVMWLHEKHEIWIVADYYNDGDNDIWFYNLKLSTKESMEEGFNSPTKAYQEAIKYCLTKLI